LRYTPFDEKLYDVDRNLLTQKAVLIETKLGEVIIYDSRLLHYSEGNRSDDYRVACAGIFLPDGAPALHYFLNGTIMKEYQTDFDFYCSLVPGEEPNITSLKTFHFSETASSEKIVEFLKNTQHVVEEKK
jgi:hypothetical protein